MGYIPKLIKSTDLDAGLIADQTSIGTTPAGADELLLSDSGVLKAVTVTNLLAASSGVPSDVVAYRASGQGTPAGWAEYPTVRGKTIVGLVSEGNDGGGQGDPLTDEQDKDHSHTGPSHTHILALGGAHPSESIRVDDVFGTSGTAAAWVRGGSTTDTNTKDRNITDAGGTGGTGTAATSDVMPYIQLMAIKSD
tara:strand:- start:4 stop:585 length:582 start_codon:yes stop_codon:yes gene_type:complete